MLRFLDNNRNNRRQPNENFARELMELFTLGPGHYSEQDIKEAARAFTGWSFRGSEFRFIRRAHDAGKKTFMGKTGNFDGDDVIDIIFEHPEASRFVVRKVFVYFVHEDPPEDVIESMASTFRRSGFEMKPVLSELLRSPEFYSERARGSQIKSPVQLVAGTMRLLEIDPASSAAPAGIAGRMGQNLFAPPNVKGWSGGTAWVTSSNLLSRHNIARTLISPPRPRPGRDPVPTGISERFSPYDAVVDAGLSSPPEIV